MSMKVSLQLGMSQQLALTPQLQQAIRLLQLSTVDLQHEIQQVIENNPMLEIIPHEEKDEVISNEDMKCSSDIIFDSQWGQQLYTNNNKKKPFDELDFNYENLYCTTNSLQDHLRWQLGLTPMSDTDRVIATAIIDAINPDGFLTISIDDLQASLNTEEYPIEHAEIEAVRHLVQHFEPLGCAAQDLAETLLIQLSQVTDEHNDVKLASCIIKNDIELLGQHNYRQIIKNYQINENRLNNILKIIRSLNPKPGNIIQQSPTEFIIPDVIVRKKNDIWQVTLNQNIIPKLNINSQYASLIQRSDESPDNQFLKQNLQEARWFLKSIQNRQETLLKVSECIVNYQQDFLEHGAEAMRPLILNDVAFALSMHESTISRVTTQKFMHTPRGVFELKYFFSSHVNTKAGGECSSTAIRALIKKLIAAENRKKPLSDSKIAKIIGEKGIKIARRTVAKYREAMAISASNERKIITTIK